MASFVVKAPPPRADAETLTFDEKSMWRGKTIAPGDEVFLFAAEHHGGCGLYARGVVVAAARGEGSRVRLTVTRTALAKRPLGRAELRAYRDRPDGGPGAELDHRLYEQATNKVSGISEATAAFLETYF